MAWVPEDITDRTIGDKVTKTPPSTPTPEQATWDEKNLHNTRNWIIAGSGIATAFLAALVWIFTTWIAPHQVPIGSAFTNGDPLTKDAISDLSMAQSVLLLLIVATFIGGPLLSGFVRNSDLALGERPADDYTPYVPMPVDIVWEQISEDSRVARIGDHEFGVRRFSEKRFFKRRNPRYGYEIRPRDRPTYTMMVVPCVLKSEGEDAAQGILHDHISEYLDLNTDYFKRR